jgi:DNA-binding LacI/PurR family transcriptional regulator
MGFFGTFSGRYSLALGLFRCILYWFANGSVATRRPVPVRSIVRKAPKRAEARQRLEEMISRQRLRGQYLRGERDLAEELGVGRQTMRAVLDDLAALGVVDRRQGLGTYVTGQPGKPRRPAAAQIAVIADGAYHQEEGWVYKGQMMRAVLGWARRLTTRCEVLNIGTPRGREQVFDARYMAGFSGFISVQLDDRTLLNHLVRLRRGPVVLLDHTVRDLPVVGVVNGNTEGARATTRHLLALGHRRIGFVDCFNSALGNPERIAGYQSALFEKGVAFSEELVVPQPRASVEMDAGAMAAFAEEAVARLLGLADPATAIFAFNDHSALPAMAALEKRGLRVGENFCLAGYGDSAVRRGLCDRLTSCRIYPRMMGREAIKAALAGGELREGRTIIVPDRLHIRKTTCPPSLNSFGGLRSLGEGACPPSGRR